MATEWLPLTADAPTGIYWVKTPKARDPYLANVFCGDHDVSFVNLVTGPETVPAPTLGAWVAGNPGSLYALAVAPPTPGAYLTINGTQRALVVSNSDCRPTQVTRTNLDDLTVYDCQIASASVGKVDLSGLRLSHANLFGAVFDECDFASATLTNVNLSGVTVDGVPILRKPLLVSVSPSGDYLTVHGAVPSLDVDLVPCEISGVSLTAGEAADLLRQAIV